MSCSGERFENRRCINMGKLANSIGPRVVTTRAQVFRFVGDAKIFSVNRREYVQDAADGFKREPGALFSTVLSLVLWLRRPQGG